MESTDCSTAAIDGSIKRGYVGVQSIQFGRHFGSMPADPDEPSRGKTM